MLDSPEDKAGRVHIETYGCEMNRADSEIVSALLEEQGYLRAEHPDDAGVILVNTCAIREHAQERALANIAQLKRYKEADATVRIGVLGCLSTHLGETIAARLPFLDWILGPDAYRSLPVLLRTERKKQPTILLQSDRESELYEDLLPARRDGINAWVTISRGCSNHCTYCVVPKARGPERHRPLASIMREVNAAVEEGFPQVTLLGQNVNSWRGGDDGTPAFPDLLRQVAETPGLKRVRFLTSHPKDCSDELIHILGRGGAITPQLHLPVQAGSNAVLKRMNRRYTAEHYLELVDKAQNSIPGLLLSTDIIVGFPGESAEDFRRTLELVQWVGFDEAFVYKYSPRLGTPAFKLEDDVPDEVKIERLTLVNDVIRRSGRKRREKLIGSTLPVLIESDSARDPNEWMGRSPAGHVIVLPKGEQESPGDEISVRIEELSGFTLRGIRAD
ncbi:tRNA (N6-isopentenyl adenosine(37)-C2)-methylthiotransferase MiaB [bacterium]|nr:tRNA (N6-isopentenyl adenosine(37)-C2)-methylthiotransferase MiaB [bacterium]